MVCLILFIAMFLLIHSLIIAQTTSVPSNESVDDVSNGTVLNPEEILSKEKSFRKVLLKGYL